MSSGTKFQFTPLREGRLANALTSLQVTEFQFTPLREGRLDAAIGNAIHIDFNSRPSARGDTSKFGSAWTAGNFNSRPSARGDDTFVVVPSSSDFNSRPSARGDLTCLYYSQIYLFQFTPLREGRRHRAGGRDNRAQFQFTPLREGRLTEIPQLKWINYFNSRPSARGDVVRVIVLHRGFLFQFTPLREGRPDQLTSTISRPAISIHAPPRGATNDE